MGGRPARIEMKRAVVEVTVAHAPWRAALPRVREICRRAARAGLAVAAMPKVEAGLEISILLGTDLLLGGLNRQYRGVEGPTNVLSFPALEAPQKAARAWPRGAPLLLGDLVLAFETIEAESARSGKSLADHLAHLVVHGVLHLAGYDHATEGEAVRMRRLETSALGRLGIPEPYSPKARTSATRSVNALLKA